jgi:hypothetical protein
MQENEYFCHFIDRRLSYAVEAYVCVLQRSCNETVSDVGWRLCTVRGWLDCGLLGIGSILCGQRKLTSRKDMLAASSALKYYVHIEAKLSLLYTVL